MTQQRVYHWKHGWIPLDSVAAAQKHGGRSITNPDAQKALTDFSDQVQTALAGHSDRRVAPALIEGRRQFVQKLGVEPPRFEIGKTRTGAAGEFAMDTKTITFDPSQREHLEDWRRKRISLGGGLDWNMDVYQEAAVHESSHAVLDEHLTHEQQIEALREGAIAAGMQPPGPNEYMNATGAWAGMVEAGPDYMTQDGTGPMSTNLSRYASFSNHEAIAEALTEFVVSDNPRPFAAAVGRYFLKYKR